MLNTLWEEAKLPHQSTKVQFSISISFEFPSSMDFIFLFISKCFILTDDMICSELYCIDPFFPIRSTPPSTLEVHSRPKLYN